MNEPLATGSYPGIEVAYYESPWRHYLVNGNEAVSVTSAIGVLDKSGALMHYAERLTSEGMLTLSRRNGYRFPGDMRVPEGARAFRLPKRVNDPTSNGTWLYAWSEIDRASKSDPKALIRVKRDQSVITGARLAIGHLTQLGLAHGSQTREAADRGVDVHKVWQDWMESQKIPNVHDFPSNRHGYIRALSAFIMQYSPECLESEKVVGSAEHMFAGRLDTVVTLRLPDKGLCMVDVKTSKGIYPNTHYPQLVGYEIGRRECGLEPTDNQAILQLGSNGKPELGWSDATPDDFLRILECWRSQQKWQRKGRRARS